MTKEQNNSGKMLQLLSGRWQNRDLDVVVIEEAAAGQQQAEQAEGEASSPGAAVWFLGDTDPFGVAKIAPSEGNTFEVEISYNEPGENPSKGVLKGGSTGALFPNQIQWMDGDFWVKIDYGESDETSSERNLNQEIQFEADDVSQARRWTKNGQLGSDQCLTDAAEPPRISDLPTDKTRRHLLLSNEAVEDMPMSPLCRSPAGKSGINFDPAGASSRAD